ncbi:DUF6573 family protein [Promicromonospora sp. NFX87]|uniref:DUF6573 family protein n=1 Tax=Promicromonospora sp. NFX87 TaxID=3402691 RepID=UPI003AFA850E
MSNSTNESPAGFWGHVVHTYLVADAVADGTMIPVDQAVATEAGFKIPVIMSARAWADLVTWDRDENWQDEAGRLWDVLFMTALAASVTRDGAAGTSVTIGRVPNRTSSGTPSRAQKPQRVTFEAVVQAYDMGGEPCLTIYLPEER